MLRRARMLAVGLCLIAFVAVEAQPQADAPAIPAPCLAQPVAADGTSVSLTLPGVRYECMEVGRGQHLLVGSAGAGAEAVLLVHGLGYYAHRDWRHVIPELSKRYRVIAVDLPGFGGSPALPQGYSFDALAAVLAKVLDNHALARVHVVGHSLGGALSLHFAHTYPQRTDRLVLVDAAGMLLKSVYVHHVSQITAPQIGIAPVDRLLGIVDDRINGLKRHIAYRFESTFDFSAWLAANPTVRIALLGRFTQTDAALGLIEHDFTRAIRETTAPTTVIWGRNDDVSPVRVGELLAGRLPNATLHVIERTGHVPMSEARQEFMPLLERALTEPLSARISAAPSGDARDVVCRNEANRVYSGRFAHVTLENCRDVRIVDAQVAKLTVVGSSVTLDNTMIAGSDVGIEAHNSFVTATVLDVQATGVALSLDDSQFDFAGATIRAGKAGVRLVTPSRIYFTVSDMAAPDYTGDLHRIWDAPPLRPTQ